MPQFRRANRQRRTNATCPFAETALRCLPAFDGANRAQCRSGNFAPAVNRPIRDKSQSASRRVTFALLGGSDCPRLCESKLDLPDSEQTNFASHPDGRDTNAYRTHPDCVAARLARQSRKVSAHRRIPDYRASEQATSHKSAESFLRTVSIRG